MDSLIPTSVFIGSAVLFIVSHRLRQSNIQNGPLQRESEDKPKSESSSTRSIQNGHNGDVSAHSMSAKYVAPISKEETLKLRHRFFAKNVTLSYSNSGSLMIVGVSLFDCWIVQSFALEAVLYYFGCVNSLCRNSSSLTHTCV